MVKELILGTIFDLATLALWFLLNVLIKVVGPPIIILVIIIMLSFSALAYFSNKRKYK